MWGCRVVPESDAHRHSANARLAAECCVPRRRGACADCTAHHARRSAGAIVLPRALSHRLPPIQPAAALKAVRMRAHARAPRQGMPVDRCCDSYNMWHGLPLIIALMHSPLGSLTCEVSFPTYSSSCSGEGG